MYVYYITVTIQQPPFPSEKLPVKCWQISRPSREEGYITDQAKFLTGFDNFPLSELITKTWMTNFDYFYVWFKCGSSLGMGQGGRLQPSLLASCCLGCRFGDLALFDSRFLHTLDHTYSYGLLHVTNSKSSEGRVLGESFHAHRLGRFQCHHGSVSWLDEFGVLLQDLARTAVDLLLDILELAGNVGGVTIQHWRVSSMNFTRMVEDDDLQNGWIMKLTKLRIRAYLHW